MDKLNILLPVETINRELDSRLLLAAYLVGDDRRVFVGQHDLLFRLMPHLRGGVWIGKNIFPNEAPWETYERYRAVRARDFVVVHLDEEGAIFPGGPDQWPKWIHQRLDVTRLDDRDWVCTWGDFQRDVYASVSTNVTAKLVTTGHPRFDLCRPDYAWFHEPEVERLRHRFGKFVLVNTNLTFANPGPGPALTFDVSSGWDVSSPAARLNFMRWYGHTNRVLVGFLSLVNRLSIEIPDLTIIVRPHPSESFEFYECVFRGVPNVKVLHEGSVVPWIRASVAMIHDGCTTGVEGSITNVPVINYKPVEAAEFDPELPNRLGVRCETEQSVVDVIRQLLEGASIEQRPVPEVARRMLANYDRPATPALIHAVTDASADVKPRDCRYNRFAVKALARSTELATRTRHVVRTIGPAAIRRRMTDPRAVMMFNQMFYGFSRGHIEQKVRLLAKRIGRSTSVDYISGELFVVEAT